MKTRPQVVETDMPIEVPAEPSYEEMALGYPSPLEVQPEAGQPGVNGASSNAPDAIQTPTVAELYEQAGIHTPAHGFSISKIAEMLSSGHIQSLPAEAKRASILMALEACNVPVTEIVEDANRRDRALNEFEAQQQKNFQDLKARKQELNQQIQAQIDCLIEQCRARIEENDKEVASEKARLDEWRIKKREEERRIRSAVSHFGAPASGGESDANAAAAAPQRPAPPEPLQMPATAKKPGDAQDGADNAAPSANGSASKKSTLWRR